LDREREEDAWTHRRKDETNLKTSESKVEKSPAQERRAKGNLVRLGSIKGEAEAGAHRDRTELHHPTSFGKRTRKEGGEGRGTFSGVSVKKQPGIEKEQRKLDQKKTTGGQRSERAGGEGRRERKGRLEKSSSRHTATISQWTGNKKRERVRFPGLFKYFSNTLPAGREARRQSP